MKTKQVINKLEEFTKYSELHLTHLEFHIKFTNFMEKITSEVNQFGLDDRIRIGEAIINCAVRMLSVSRKRQILTIEAFKDREN